jgi:RNA methyltransferase, TrmH family
MLDLKPISDINLPKLQIYHQLRDNAFTKDNSFIADSPKVVNILLETSLDVKSLLATQEYYETFETLIATKNIPDLYVADKQQMQQIVGHKIHHNVMMHGIRPVESNIEDLGEHILMLDLLSSTENVGSIARSAAAMGVDSYLIPKSGPHPYGRRALRVSMGHVSKLKIHQYEDITQTIIKLKSLGYRIIGAEITADSIPLSKIKIPQKWVLLMGHEGKGLSLEVIALCDELVNIEMVEGIKSFNVSVAASILMYQFQHGGK